ncbi:hypothetical protein A0H81_01569 [Grifola frondosa]|uniref:Uncharacterized protein n=1 Tax=Grifola frondosa TaxID=5627 RepID=A0A1C7MSB3_GRIFR|nr:hypothetical protein A0H81_01569 [Grifola frondosa]
MSQKPKVTPEPIPGPGTWRTRSVRNRSLWESYAVLPAKTRLRISLYVTAIAVVGIFVSDKLEDLLPIQPKEQAQAPQHANPSTP